MACRLRRLGDAKRLTISVALIVVLALLATPPASATPVDGATRQAPAVLRIGTYNIHIHTSQPKFIAAVTAARPFADVFGLQEASCQRAWDPECRPAAKMDYLLRGDPMWGAVAGGGVLPSQNGNFLEPVIYRKDLFEPVAEFPRGEMVPLQPAATLERVGGGTEVQRATYATVARLVHLPTGQTISVINAHLINGAVLMGRPWAKKYPGRWAYYRKQLAALVKLAASESIFHPGRVYVTGDFNSDYYKDKLSGRPTLAYARFRAVGFRSMWAGREPKRPQPGTQGTMWIDQVWNSYRPISKEIRHELTGSDHRPAIATYALQ